MSSASRAARPAAVLIVAALGLLGIAWAFANPLGAAPDEPAHYIRAVAAGDGHLTGSKAVWSDVALTPRQEAYVSSTTRRFSAPSRLLPVGTTFPCFALRPSAPADCRDRPTHPGRAFHTTYIGAYQPVPYILSGVVADRFPTESSAFRAARLGALALCLALLVPALLLYADTAGRLAAFALGVTPVSVFLAATVNGSGLEIAAATAFFAAVLAAARTGRGWTLVAVSGAVAAWCRPLSPAWVVIGAVLVVLTRPSTTRQRGARRAAAVLFLACAGSAGWDLLSGLHGALGTPTGFLSGLPRVLVEQVTTFGWGATQAPLPVAALWYLAIGAMVVAAARRRAVAMAVAVAAYGAMMMVIAVGNAGSGYGLAGRYILPLLPLLPLLAGELVAEWPRRAAGAVLLGWGLFQGLCWYYNSRRYAVGSQGPLSFFSAPDWSPPGGWWPWLVLAGAAVLAAGAAGMQVWAGGSEPVVELTGQVPPAVRTTGPA